MLGKTVRRQVQGITVERFLRTYGDQLKLELISGRKGLQRVIREGSINRPALALTGFFKYFANKRIQVFGAAEMTYLKTLSEDRQREILNQLVDRVIPCIVLSRNFHPTASLLEIAEKRNLALMRTPMITMDFVNTATICIDYEFAPSATEHGTSMDIKGIGVLIRGSSGVGKSECALALIERGHSLVSDDLTRIKLIDEKDLMASSLELNRGHMECRGIGIINVAEMFGVRSVRLEKRIDLVVSLLEMVPGANEDRTGLEQNFYEILGIQVPHIEIFVRPGRDLARLVEVAALVQALKKLGHDPAKEFNDRLIAFMANQGSKDGDTQGVKAKVLPSDRS
ncbi:MAG: HPr(Ser) kinase/phosphatase [Puniceicoccaceae bacterium]|nr:MAG: HPr(Ser) kinase/phosphatase [Puniceicoccaceae bacterium]